MVEQLDSPQPGDTIWVVRPTRSLTWPEAKRWLCVISFIPLSGGLLFLWFGIPLVLPFAGLEVALLWGAFYYVAWTGEMREVIRLTPDRLIIERGRHTQLLDLNGHYASNTTAPGCVSTSTRTAAGLRADCPSPRTARCRPSDPF